MIGDRSRHATAEPAVGDGSRSGDRSRYATAKPTVGDGSRSLASSQANS